MIGGIAALAAFGLHFGIDFTGGSLLEVTYTERRLDVSVVHETIAPLEIGEILVQPAGDRGVLLRFREVDEETHQKILDALRGLGEGMEEQRFTTIGPTIGHELRRKAFVATVAATLGIMLYIAWAFRKASRPVASWHYGFITAMVALLHDALIPLGLFAFLGRFYGWEVGIPFVAAMLTVVGFSVHDTIVVFDRTRENLKRAERDVKFGDVVNRSLNQTLGRSIMTSLTVLLTVVALWFLGGATLRPFAAVLFVGIIAGTYSSICIASPFLVDIQRFKFRIPRLRMRK